MFWNLSDAEKRLLHEIREFKEQLASEFGLVKSMVELKKQISDLETEKSKIEERYAREERELRHMIGLERKRQEFEIEQSKREVTLTVQKENLAADKKRFEEQLQFNTARFEKMETYLKQMMEKVLERLPTVTVDQTITKKK